MLEYALNFKVLEFSGSVCFVKTLETVEFFGRLVEKYNR